MFQNKLLKKLQNNWFLVSVIMFNALVAISAFYLLNFSLPKINIKNILNYNKEFSISPVYNNAFVPTSSIKYPFVQVPPWDFRYRFVPNKEIRAIRIKKYDELFFAEKRIAELLKWGDLLPVSTSIDPDIIRTLHSANDERAIISIKNWWNKQKSKNYNSWEAILIRYLNHIENKKSELISQTENDYLNSPKELILLASRLRAHHQDLKTQINMLKKSDDQKKYLLRLNDIIYRQLSNNIISILPRFDPQTIYFPISDVFREKEFGTYDIVISNIPNISASRDRIYLKWNNQIFQSSYGDVSENEIVFKNIKIINSLDKISVLKNLSIQLPETNLAKNIIWGRPPDTYLGYYGDIENKENHHTYYLRFKSDLKPFFRLTLEKQYQTRGNEKKLVGRSDILIDQPFNTTPADKLDLFETLIQLTTGGEKGSSIFHFAIESSVPITNLDLQSFELQFVPVYNALMTLKRVPELSLHKPIISQTKLNPFTYQVYFKNSSLTEETYAIEKLLPSWHVVYDKHINTSAGMVREVVFMYRPLLLLFYLWILFNSLSLLFVLYLGIKQILKKNQFISIRAWFQKSMKLIYRYFSMVKYVLPFILIIAIPADIFWLKSYSDLLLILLTFCWIGVILIYKLDAKTSFIFALMCLLIAPFYAFYKNDGVAEKLGVWSFEFLLIGTVQSVIEIKYPPRLYNLTSLFYKKLIFISSSIIKTVPLPAFLRACLKLVVKLIHALFKICSRAINSIIIFLQYIIKSTFYYPHNIRDFANILIRSGIIFISVIFLFLVYQRTYFFVDKLQKTRKEEQRRQGLNPQIKKLEPRIVYYATKIIIFGDGFGSKESKRVRLKKDKEIVETNIWTDSKIIFTVPLHWKTGRIKLWIEKETEWKSKQIIVKSDVITIRLLPRSATIGAKDDAYFQQLKTLEDETLKINGYRPEDY